MIRIDPFAFLIKEAIDGRLPPDEAAGDVPEPIASLLRIAHKLGQLSRGGVIELTPSEAGLLHQAVDFGVDVVLSGRPPLLPDEMVATMLMDLVFEIADPFTWAGRLSMICRAERPMIIRPE